MMLPGDYPTQVEITLSLGDQFALLANSLLLPLLGFIIGGCICDNAQAGEMGTVFGAIVGLAVGVVMCRKQSYSRMKINEVGINE